MRRRSGRDARAADSRSRVHEPISVGVQVRSYAPGRSGDGWLPGVIPADARRFRVVDPDLAASLAASGAELVDSSPDVEIASAAEEIGGEAPIAVLTVEAPPRGARPLLVRAAMRLLGHLRVRARAGGARRALRRRGYENVSVLGWEVGQRAELPGVPAPERRLIERLPERALVLGARGPRGPTSLEAALAAAGIEAGVEPRSRWASVRAGVVLVATDAGLLRAAIGGGSYQIANHAAALEALGRAGASELVAERVPWLLARGRTGLVDWSLERFLPGVNPPRALTPALLEECVDFLVALQRALGGRDGGQSLVDFADTAAGVCRPESAARLRALGERLELELAAVPRCFGHGDFFAGNLLTHGTRLTGVIDWDAGGPGRLPLVDLLHLQLTRVDYGGDDEWGRAVVGRLLPLARAGGDAAVRRYCREVGLEADPALIEALALAYWLGYVAYQLETHVQRRSQPEWIEGNVELPLAAMIPP